MGTRIAQQTTSGSTTIEHEINNLPVMNSLLPHSTMTTDELMRKCFPELGRNVAQFVEASPTQIANESSFWSQIVKVKLKWKETIHSDVYPHSLFVKIPYLSANAGMSRDRGLLDVLVDMTCYEILFYEMKNNDVISLCPMPRLYHTEEMDDSKEGGLLVLEDIGENAVSMDYVPGLTIPQVEVVIDALAGFHHYVMCAKHDWCSVFDRLDASFISVQFECAMRLEQVKPEWFKGKIEKIKPYFTQKVAEQAPNSSRELGIPPVLVHSDLNVTDILWDRRTTESYSPKLLSIVDFQQVHKGNICEDIARLLMLSLSVEDRRGHTHKLLARYHSTITTLFNGTPPFGFEKVEQAYDRIFLYASQYVLFGLTIYYEMYEKNEKDELLRNEKRLELLTRAKGIVDDALTYIQ